MSKCKLTKKNRSRRSASEAAKNPEFGVALGGGGPIGGILRNRGAEGLTKLWIRARPFNDLDVYSRGKLRGRFVAASNLVNQGNPPPRRLCRILCASESDCPRSVFSIPGVVLYPVRLPLNGPCRLLAIPGLITTALTLVFFTTRYGSRACWKALTILAQAATRRTVFN